MIMIALTSIITMILIIVLIILIMIIIMIDALSGIGQSRTRTS